MAQRNGRESGNGPTLDLKGIAHDMRTPLFVVKTFLECCASPPEAFVGQHAAAKRSIEKIMGVVKNAVFVIPECLNRGSIAF